MNESTTLPCRCGTADADITNLTCGLDENDRSVELISVTCQKCGRGVQAPNEPEAVGLWNIVMDLPSELQEHYELLTERGSDNG